MKYLVLSFDDATTYDRKVVELLNKYQLKGTFFVNSGTLDTAGFLSSNELSTLFKGHEVGAHGVNHINLKDLTKDEILYQIERDVKSLEGYMKIPVEGFAYPFGDYNKKVLKATQETKVKYARTVKGTIDFKQPKDFFEWHPTMHFSGMAWDTDDRERRNRGVQFMLDKVEEFLDDPNAEIIHLWMHSWEFKDDRFKWDQLERLFRIISQEEEVYSVTCMEYYNKKNKTSK